LKFVSLLILSPGVVAPRFECSHSTKAQSYSLTVETNCTLSTFCLDDYRSKVIESQVAIDAESISKRPMFFRVSRKTTDAQ
jgi:hypothetical protein